MMQLTEPKYSQNDIVVTMNNRLLYLMEYKKTHTDNTLELWLVYDSYTKQQFEHWLQIPFSRRVK